jgi:hypothetical protein
MLLGSLQPLIRISGGEARFAVRPGLLGALQEVVVVTGLA